MGLGTRVEMTADERSCTADCTTGRLTKGEVGVGEGYEVLVWRRGSEQIRTCLAIC